VDTVRRVEMEAAGHGDEGHWRGGVSASVRRDTNAARRTAVPDGLAKMTPSGRGRQKDRAPQCAAGPDRRAGTERVFWSPVEIM